MVVAAVLAAPRVLGFDLTRSLHGTRELDSHHLVAGPFVVDERARAELADGQESGPLEVVTFTGSASGSAAGDVGREG